eukprot:299334-Hanusia_phi.AAC.1
MVQSAEDELEHGSARAKSLNPQNVLALVACMPVSVAPAASRLLERSWAVSLVPDLQAVHVYPDCHGLQHVDEHQPEPQ